MSQDTRRLLTDARAIPPLTSGVMINSRTVRSESSTSYVLDFPDGLRWAKIPLLTDNFSKRAPPVGRPSQDKLLGAGCFVFLSNERYASQLLRLVEEQPNRFVRTEIDPSVPVDGGYFVKQGVAAGARIATSSAGLLLARELGTEAAD